MAAPQKQMLQLTGKKRQFKSGYHLPDLLPSAFAFQKGPPGRYTLIDKTWTLGSRPLAIVKQPYTFTCNGTSLTITHDVLLSTPSNIQLALTSNSFSADRRAYVSGALSILGSGNELVVHTILDYMQSGRFDSAVYNNSQYTLSFSTSIIEHAVLCGMTIVKALAIIEMKREFFGRLMGPGLHLRLVDMTKEEIERLANVGYDQIVWESLFLWAMTIFRYPEGKRVGSKGAVQAVLEEKGKGKGGRSPINGPFVRHMKELEKVHGEDGKMWKQGEVGRFRNLVRANAPKGEGKVVEGAAGEDVGDED